MITGATKNKVDDIWQRMWEGVCHQPHRGHHAADVSHVHEILG